jgi:hypothetical protein
MKKILCLVITIFAVITLFSCGDQKQPAQPDVATPEPSTIVVPDEKPKEENNEIGISFMGTFPPTLFHSENPGHMAAQWLRTEEEVATLRANMEHSFVYQVLFAIKQADPETIMDYHKSVTSDFSLVADMICEIKKIDAEFLKTHTVLLFSLPIWVGEMTAKRVNEDGVSKVHIEAEFTGGHEGIVNLCQLVILDEVIENQDQIVFSALNCPFSDPFEITWSTIEDQTE